MRAAIYARVSSQKQRDAQTIASQMSALREFCRGRGWEVVGEFIDDGKTAKEGAENIAARRGLLDLHAAARAGKLDVVAVVDVDRLCRSEFLDDRAAVYGPMQRAGIPIVVAATGSMIEWGTDTGDLLLGVGNMQSSGWLRKHRERVLRGKEEAIRRGGKPAGPTPFGYSYDRATRTWSVHPVFGPMVAEIYRRVVAGDTCYSIARDFHERGLTRPRGGIWSKERVWQLARSRTYRGEWIADKAKGLTVPVPAIVSVEEWEAAQRAMSAQWRRGRPGPRVERASALLMGRVMCGVCGGAVGVCFQGVGRKRHVYYVCRRRRDPPWNVKRCTLPYQRAAALDEDAWEQLRPLIERPEYVREVLERQVDAGAVAELERDLERAEKRLEQHDKAEARILSSYSQGRVSEAAYEQHLAESQRRRVLLAQQVDGARSALEASSRTTRQIESAVEALALLRDRLRDAGPEDRREAVLALLPGPPYVATLNADGTVDVFAWLGLGIARRSAAGSSSDTRCDVKLRVVRSR